MGRLEKQIGSQGRKLASKFAPMRTHLLLVLALTGAIQLGTSQITIGSADLPQPDVTYPLVTAAITDLSLGEITGADATWDASNLVPLTEAPITPVNISNASISAAIVFNSPFNSTYQCDFFLPTEFPDLGVDMGIPIEGFNNFYQTDGDAYTIAGVGLSAMGFDLPVPYDDIDEMLPLPLTYGSTLSSTAAFELDVTGVLSYGLDQQREVEADGWGTLLLPSGSYDVLRTRTFLTATDDVFIEQLGEPFSIDREQVTYQWWGAGMGYPLLEITEIFGLPLTATFQDLGSTNNSVAESTTSTEFTAYPNPVRRGEPLHWNDEATFSLFDGSGRTVASGKGKECPIPVGLATGRYTLQLSNGMTTAVFVH